MELSEVIQSASRILEATANDHRDDLNVQIAVEICTRCSFELRNDPLSHFDHPVYQAWSEVIPIKYKTHAQPSGYKNGTLFVSVNSSAWLADIVRHRRREFLALLQAKLGSDTIRRVSYREGTVATQQTIIFHLPAGLLERSNVVFDPSNFGNARNCISFAINQALRGIACGIQFCEIEERDKQTDESAAPLPGHSVELHLEMLHSDLQKALMPYNAKSVQGESLQSLAVGLSDRFRKSGARWWAAFKRAEELRDPRVGELRALANIWYVLADACDSVAGPVSEGARQIVSGLSKLNFHPQKQPEFTFQGAEIKWEATKIAIIVVKSHILHSEADVRLFKSRFMEVFDGAHIILAAELPDGLTYMGRTDIAEYVATIPPIEIPWREYTLPIW
jgi:hypothetical protein